MNVVEMRQKRASLHEEMKKLHEKAKAENRDLATEEIARWDTLKGEIESLRAAIEREERLESEERYLAKPAGNVPRDGDPEKPNNDSDFRSLGEFLGCVAAAAKAPHRAIDARLEKRDVRAVQGMSEGVPADGGFLLQPQHERVILDRIYDQGQVLNRCQPREIGVGSNEVIIDLIDESSRADGSRWGGVRAYWEAEGDAVTGNSKLKFGQVSVKLAKLFALCYATDEDLQDLPQLESKIMQIVPNELLFKAEDAIIRGTGVGQMQGILTSDALVTIAKETGQAADTIVSENILKMWKAGWGRFSSVWLYNQELEDQLETLTVNIGTGGELARLFIPPTGDRNYGTIKGRPAIPIEQASGPGDVGDLMLCDLSQFVIGRKGGVQAASSVHVQFLTDQSCFRFTWRINGRSSWKSKLTPYKRTSTDYYQSPFVTLAAR